MENDSISYSYESIWKAIIRPPRDNYDPSVLGDSEYEYRGNIYTKTDYTILSKRGFLMKCSFFQLNIATRSKYTMPVVIYLHGNSSSRVEGTKLKFDFFKKGINLFVFDFSGCGLSEGKYISLGYHEKHDVKIIVDFVEKIPGVGKIGLWGRSMGAATIMMYAAEDDRICAVCMDSPYADFRLLARDLCSNYSSVPGFIVDTAMLFVKRSVKNRNDFDFNDIRPIDYAASMNIPGFFIHAMNDELIPLEHTMKLFDKYSGNKSLNVVDGGHNSVRQKHVIEKAIKFFETYLSS